MKKRKEKIFKKYAALLGICVLMGGLAAGCGKTEGDAMEAREETFAGAQAFSKALFAKGMAETNPVESPVSAYLAMALAGEGAKGDTAAEFDAVMGTGRQAMSQAFMQTYPCETEGTQIALANSAWLDDRLTCEADWLETASKYYLAQVQQTRLSDPETMERINVWVQENTRGLIKAFLQEPLDDMTRVALFNTVYFKGKWQSAFSASATGKLPFTRADGMQTEVDMMRKTGNMYYVQGIAGGAGKSYDGVALPYRDSELLFVAVKPTDGQSVRELYESLEFSALGEAVEAAREESRRVNLWLPKFKVSFDRILNHDLTEIGLAKAFDSEQADFGGIGTADGNRLYVSLVRQKAVFIVDEDGTEAAAVTEVTMMENAAMPMEEPIEVHFDEPFLYMIFDTEEDIPLFVGIMDDPSRAQGAE